MLTNYPKILKYTVDDRPYFIDSNYKKWVGSFFNGRGRGFIRRCMITGWRTEVYASGTTPVQETYYTVKVIAGYDPEQSESIGFTELYEAQIFEIEESKLFSSSNHLIGYLDGGSGYLNYAYNSDGLASSIMRAWGTAPDGTGPSFQDWCDYARMDFKNAQLGTIEGTPLGIKFTWSGNPGDPMTYTGGEASGDPAPILDGSNFTGASMPSGFTTRSGLRTNSFSFDAVTTLWTDGYPVGRALTGTAAGSSGGTAITGTSTLATTEFCIGDQIVIQDIGIFTIASISSATSFAVAETLPSTFSGKIIARL